MGASAAEKLVDLQTMVAGLKADAAFARWKQEHHADALYLYVEVLELLEEIPIDKDLQTRHVHATVRHCLGWIITGARDTSETGHVEPPPGMCSNPEPYEALKDRSFIEMSAVWGMLGNIDTRLGTGLDLTLQAERKSDGALPLIVRFNDRLARYQALWDGTDFPSAVSIFIKMVEASICFNQVRAA